MGKQGYDRLDIISDLYVNVDWKQGIRSKGIDSPYQTYKRNNKIRNRKFINLW